MGKLPRISGKKLVKILESLGYNITRQKGSHIRLHHKNKLPITVPNHKIIGIGLLKKILRDAKINKSEIRKHFTK